MKRNSSIMNNNGTPELIKIVSRTVPNVQLKRS